MFISSISFAKSSELPTVSSVSIERYVGKWYSIAALPQFFTRKCIGQTADYKIIGPQTISVLNTCFKKNGSSTISGKAVVLNTATNAELEVTFDSFFTRLFRVKGEYNIIKLDKDYKFVLVGTSDRDSLWIMSRTPIMPTEEYDAYVKSAAALGFPVEKLERSKF
jgi:apolipoprotein D and lipocalin family protein